MYIIVANEPRSYREAIGRALRVLKPLATVFVVEPEDLDRELARREPGFVVCSCLTAAVERSVPAWVELYPDHGPGAVVGLGAERTELDGMDLDGLLSAVDRAGSQPAT